MGADQSSDSYNNPVLRSENVKTMENFDVNRFVGEKNQSWYEIAHTVGSDGHQCNNAIAQYEATSSPSQFIVHNICYINKKPAKVMSGIMRMPDANVSSKLKVKFEGIANREFDYWVFFTDYDKYALVGSSSGHYWILGRESQVGLCVVKALKQFAEKKGLGKDKDFVFDLDSVVDCDALEKQRAQEIQSQAQTDDTSGK